MPSPVRLSVTRVDNVVVMGLLYGEGCVILILTDRLWLIHPCDGQTRAGDGIQRAIAYMLSRANASNSFSRTEYKARCDDVPVSAWTGTLLPSWSPHPSLWCCSSPRPSTICQQELSHCSSLSTQHVRLSGVRLCRPD